MCNTFYKIISQKREGLSHKVNMERGCS